MLDAGASVNFYMFFGGTNFGFTAGANDGKIQMRMHWKLPVISNRICSFYD